ncbi:MAG: APC family permease [Actinomycetota bacterium]|nr:APC family permease [Actinomycetota bacterium]
MSSGAVEEVGHERDESRAGGVPAREFKFSSAFALAFSDISPIVGIYSVFAISIVLAGPGFFWALPLVLIGQLLVTAVFGDLVSKWPFQGSVYAWSRELIGPRYGWFTNWAYMWGLTLTLSVLGLAAAGYLLGALGVNSASKEGTAAVALGIILLGTTANMLGGNVLKRLLYITLACELVASIGIGTVLLFFHKTQPLSVLFSGAGSGHAPPVLLGPFLGAVAFVGYSFVGFEAAGSIAEEVAESRRVLPKAMTLSLAVAGGLVIYACLGVMLAIPSVPDVLSGKVVDPISTTLETRLGSGFGRALLIVLTIGFTASLIAVQAAVSRAIWAGARDRALPFAGTLGKLSGRHRMPRHAIVLTVLISAPLPFISFSKIYTLLLSFSTAGFYISYALPVIAFAYVRLKGRWIPGPVSMGRWGGPVTYVAAVWIVLESVNIAWPRTLNSHWYLNWGILIMTAVLGVIGYFMATRILGPGTPGGGRLSTPGGGRVAEAGPAASDQNV